MKLQPRIGHLATALGMIWLAAGPARPAEGAPVVRAVLFVSPSCPHCHTVRQQVLPPLAARYGSQLQVAVLSTTTPVGGRLFSAACERYWIARRAVPLLIVGDAVMMGSGEIPQRFPGLIATHLANGGVDWPDIRGLQEALQSSNDAEDTPVPETYAEATQPVTPATLPTPPIAVSTEITTSTATGATYRPSSTSEPATPPPATHTGSTGTVGVPAAGSPAVDSPAPVGSPAPAATDSASLPPSTGSATAPSTSSVIDLTGESEAPGMLALFRRDPRGNGIAVVVLAGMVLTLLVSVFILRRPADGTSTSNGGLLDWLTPILALAGLGVASYLAQVEVRQVEAVCGPVGDCNTVQQSEYARLFGVLPIGVLGVLGCLAILGAWVLRHWGPRQLSAWAAAGMLLMTTFGITFSIYLTFLEPFVIGATCLWCVSSAVIMTTMYVLALRPGRRGLAAILSREPPSRPTSRPRR